MFNSIAILTGNVRGQTADLLNRLDVSRFDITVVTYGSKKVTVKYVKKKLRKLIRIGPIAMMWNRLYLPNMEYGSLPRDVKIIRFESLNCEEMIQHFRQNNYDIGLSLGNAFISKRIFGSFKYSMLNIHHELLPEFPNCQPVIWSIFHKRNLTGWSIHHVNAGIDKGEVVSRGVVEIIWGSRLKQTVDKTFEVLISESTEGLLTVLNEGASSLSNSEYINDHAEDEFWHTTPTIIELLRIIKLNRFAWYRHNK